MLPAMCRALGPLAVIAGLVGLAGCESEARCETCSHASAGQESRAMTPAGQPSMQLQGGAGAVSAGAGAGSSGSMSPAGGAGGGAMHAGNGVAGSAGSAGSAELAGSGGTAGAAGGGGSTVVPPGDPTPDPAFLVPATGPCPELQDGYVTFMPDGVNRRVLLYMSDAAKSMHGPLIFSWHSTLPGPETSTTWLGTSVIAEIVAQGGIVAAPAARVPTSTRPWDSTALGPSGDNDQRLMDEVVACANEKVGIDLRRIHAIGMSAGGLKTAQVSLRRSGYLASVVVYSGGLRPDESPPDQDPDNAFAAMILYGGSTDISPVDGTPYPAASTKYRDLVRSRGGFAFLCDHGGGHSVPQDSQQSAWQFLQDHPYGAKPSPYAAALPGGFLDYCSLE